MNKITICGSTRFEDQFHEANKKLTLQGWIVLTVGVFGHTMGEMLSEEKKNELDKLHLKKIEMSDAIYVVNVGGYIGSSTRKEIAHAQKLGKEVIYHTPILDSSQETFSLHFTLKGQSIEEIGELYRDLVKADSGFSLTDAKVNHCFLPMEKLQELNKPLEVPYFFESICYKNVSWSGKTGKGLESDRSAMLDHIKRTGGTCIFIGDIKDGVLLEFEYAKKIGCNIATFAPRNKNNSTV